MNEWSHGWRRDRTLLTSFTFKWTISCSPENWMYAALAGHYVAYSGGIGPFHHVMQGRCIMHDA